MRTHCGDKEMTLIPELEQVLYKNPGGKFNDGYHEVQHEIFGSEDARQFVSDSTNAPFRYICQVERELPNNKLMHGTGFFIGPKTILTAAHVVWDLKNDRIMPANKIWIRPARNSDNDKAPFGKLRPSGIILGHPNFKIAFGGTYKDYAIIRLAEAKGNVTGYSVPEFGQKMRSVVKSSNLITYLAR